MKPLDDFIKHVHTVQKGLLGALSQNLCHNAEVLASAWIIRVLQRAIRHVSVSKNCDLGFDVSGPASNDSSLK
jgi:hypothetical protein